MYNSNQVIKRSFISRVWVSRLLTVFMFGLVGTYTGLVIETVSLVNERKSIREQVQQSQIAISDLEVNYFDLAQSIDTETIEELGFTESVVPVFAYTQETHTAVAMSR